MHDSGPRTSLAALEWLEYQNREYMRMPIPQKIQHAFNGRGEKRIGNYLLDGYVEWENTNEDGEEERVLIGFEFMGCRFHQCPFRCGTDCLQTDEAYEKEQKRLTFLRRNLTRLVVIYGCEWEKLKAKIRERERMTNVKILTSTISPFLSQPWVREDEILNAVANGSFYGIVCLDITTPTKVIERYEHLKFPFIFNNLSVTEEMLSEETLELAYARKMKFPVEAKTLTWNAKNFVACTPLLEFYIKLGMKLENVQWALQYERGAPFSDFVNNLVDARVTATESGNNPAGDRAKFVLNSAVVRDF